VVWIKPNLETCSRSSRPREGAGGGVFSIPLPVFGYPRPARLDDVLVIFFPVQRLCFLPTLYCTRDDGAAENKADDDRTPAALRDGPASDSGQPAAQSFRGPFVRVRDRGHHARRRQAAGRWDRAAVAG
jgi:hypothetical protein